MNISNSVNYRNKPVVLNRAPISVAVSGDNFIVAAVIGKQILVLSYVLVAAGTVTAKFKSGAAGADLTGAMPLVANGQLNVSASDFGQFVTAAGDPLNLVLSGAIAAAGNITYIFV